MHTPFIWQAARVPGRQQNCPDLSKGWDLMKKFFGFKSARRKLLVSFLVALIIPVLVGAMGYIKLRQNMIDQANKAYVDKLGQAMSGVEGLYGEIDHLADALKNTQWVAKIAFMKGNELDYSRTTVYDLSVYASELKNYQSLNNYIDRVMIVFPEKGVVMSMNGISSYEDFFSNYYKTGEIGIGQWTDLLSHYTDGFTLSPMTVSNYGKKARMLTYIRSITLPFGLSSGGQAVINNTPNAMLMISIVVDGAKADGTSKYGLRNLLNGVSGTDGASAYIVNGGNIITSLNTKGPDFSGALPSLYAGDRQVIGFRSGSTGYLAFNVKSKLNSWEYMAVIPQAAVMQPVNVPMYWVILLFLVCTVISIAVAYVLFWNNYKPLKSLVDRLNQLFPQTEGGTAEKNEYSLIDQAFQHIVAKESSLEDKLEFYYPMAVNSFFIKLLYETAVSVDDKAVKKSLGIDTLQNTWTVAVLYAEGDEGADTRTKASKWMMGDLPAYIIEVDQRRYAVIINTGDRQLLTNALAAMKAGYAGIGRVITGVGNPCEDLEQIGRSYREALSAVNYSFNADDCPDSTVFYSNIETDRSYGYRIPQETEEQLQKLLRSGDYAAMKGFLDPFLDKSIRKAGASQASIQVFFYNLLSIALKAASDSELPISALVDEQRLMTMSTAQDMKNYISNVYMMVCESLRTERHGHCQKARTDILKFIDDNCLDDKLTLQSLSDIFGVSVPYLSKFIKDQTGNNFLDYVARKRIQIAKEMLRSGQYSIQQVGERVGYVNALTFRRVFKKIEGVNPGDYRDGIGSAG